MTIESYLSAKLSRFNIIDLFFVISVYIVFSLLIAELYGKLALIDWWFYLILMILSMLPLLARFVSQPGGKVTDKMQSCLKNNGPMQQVLLFFTTFFLAMILVDFFPVLASGVWWIYVVIMVVLAIKPLQKSWIW